MCEIAAAVLGSLELKLCPRCNETKPCLSFSKRDNTKDGLGFYCKECYAKINKVRSEKNKARATIVVAEFKTCPGCNTEKPGLEFTKANREKDGLDVYCKECKTVRHRKLKYGLSDEQFKAMLEAQGGACAICKWIPSPDDGPLHVDHLHGTNIVRGLLHHKCNRGLGLFGDGIGFLSNAIDYLNGPTTGIVYKKSWSHGSGVPTAIKEQILASQNFICKICSIDLHNKRACVDHDHLTNIIRGILCDNCNLGLGQFDDSVELLTNAIAYLTNTSTVLTCQL